VARHAASLATVSSSDSCHLVSSSDSLSAKAHTQTHTDTDTHRHRAWE